MSRAGTVTVSTPIAVAILGAVVLGVAWWPVTWWPREALGPRLRRECTAIVREAYPDRLGSTGDESRDRINERFLNAELSQCIVQRGVARR